MFFCNYLFVKGYQLGIKTKSYADAPILGGLLVLIYWISGLLFGASLLISHFWGFSILPPMSRYAYGVILLGVLTIYYSYKGRGHKLVKRYEEKQHPFYQLSPYIVVPVALLLALGFLTFAGTVYNS